MPKKRTTIEKAAEENTSVSRDEYRRAYKRWKRIGSIVGIDAAGRLSREDAHARR